ncbi:MAG: hypothetical protein O3B65_00175 [Chloroflexi bacterium]|nr:hypothetical protein [Chloroflexota bacterium]
MTLATWTPQAKSAVVLARAWAHVQSVPYSVSLRWLFYRLYQDGTYSSKGDYSNKFKNLLTTARKDFYEGWRPDSLADETREIVEGGHGHDSVSDWFSAVAEMPCSLDHWASQSFYGLLAFEARAMSGQFAYYAPTFTRLPFGGDPSLDYKWRIAQLIRQRHLTHGQPTCLWYFGDLDDKGLSIFESAMRDIRDWAGVAFEVERVGLTAEQAQSFALPDSLDHPGSYQWESLSDDQARSLIEVATSEVDQSAWDGVDDDERDAEDILGDLLRREGLA